MSDTIALAAPGTTEVLHLERRDRVALLTLDRPGRLNAIGSDTVAQLHAALDVIEADPSLRAVVVTGAHDPEVEVGAQEPEPVDRLAPPEHQHRSFVGGEVLGETRSGRVELELVPGRPRGLARFDRRDDP